jgi:hypothetical protein
MMHCSRREYDWADAENLKAITMQGLWVTDAILRGEKTAENRRFAMRTGWYALHVAKSQKSIKEKDRNLIRDIPPGRIVGVIYVDGIVPENEKADNKWADVGKKSNIVRHALRLPNPILASGRQTLWKVASQNGPEVAQKLIEFIVDNTQKLRN